MLNLSVALVTLLSAATPALSHEATLDHAGSAYQLSYEPRVETRTRTVGHSIGTRPSTERCLWAIDVQVERHIRASGGAQPLTRLLPETRSIKGEHQGSCRQGEKAIAAAQAARQDEIRAHLAAVASTDRPAVLAEIDAARSLALN